MKTLKFIIGLCFIAAFSAYTVNAQNGVSKQEVIVDLTGGFIPCTGDLMSGTMTIEIMNMAHFWRFNVVRSSVIGVDTFGEPTGNVYEITQHYSEQGTDGNNWKNHGTVNLNGKVFAVWTFAFHATINKDGEITVQVERIDIDCH